MKNKKSFVRLNASKVRTITKSFRVSSKNKKIADSFFYLLASKANISDFTLRVICSELLPLCKKELCKS